MNFYDISMSPIEFMFLRNMRKKIIPLAHGNVLEIGFGTGANTALYQKNNIKNLYAIDLEFTDPIKNKFKNKIKLIEASAEAIPFKDNTFDTVVTTIALCSVEDLDQSILEIKRVLKDGGQYLFVEHVLPKNKNLATIFNKFNKHWQINMGGCNINRKTIKRFKQHNFTIKECHQKKMKVFTYGIAINNK